MATESKRQKLEFRPENSGLFNIVGGSAASAENRSCTDTKQDEVHSESCDSALHETASDAKIFTRNDDEVVEIGFRKSSEKNEAGDKTKDIVSLISERSTEPAPSSKTQQPPKPSFCLAALGLAPRPNASENDKENAEEEEESRDHDTNSYENLSNAVRAFLESKPDPCAPLASAFKATRTGPPDQKTERETEHSDGKNTKSENVEIELIDDDSAATLDNLNLLRGGALSSNESRPAIELIQENGEKVQKDEVPDSDDQDSDEENEGSYHPPCIEMQVGLGVFDVNGGISELPEGVTDVVIPEAEKEILLPK